MSSCPKCGYHNLDHALFCQSCGTLLFPQPQTHPFPRSPAYYQTSPHRGMDPTVKIIIIVAIVIGVIVIGGSAATFEYFSSTLPGRDTVNSLTLAIIYPNQATDGYFGLAYWQMNNGLPIYLGHGQTYTAKWTLTLRPGTNHTLDSATTAFSGGFSLQSVSPNLPFTLTPGSSTTLYFTIRAPDQDYNGLVTIDLLTH